MKTNTPPLIPHHRSHTTPPLLLFTEQTPEGFSATMSPDPDFTGGPSSTDIFRIDDLLDFSNEDLFPSTSSTTDTNTTTDTNHHFPLFDLSTTTTTTTSFPHDFCLPSEDVAELEWLSNFVDDSFSNFPVNNFTTPTTAAVSITSVPAKARTKRSKPTLTHHSWTSLPDHNKCKPFTKDEASSSTIGGGGRKCTHCASERTPQWRTGPMGPKTLCNACGVRYKSGRLVPEYRPAASPTFMLTRHSNSHRKVLELRRQKEVGVEDGSNGNCHEFFQHHHDYKIC